MKLQVFIELNTQVNEIILKTTPADKHLVVAIDEDLPSLIVLKKIFNSSIELRKFKLRVFESPEEGLEYLVNNTSVLIFLNWNPIFVSGQKLLKIIRARSHHKDVPVIAFGIKGEINLDGLREKIHNVHWMEKPFSEKVVLSLLKKNNMLIVDNVKLGLKIFQVEKK